MHHDKGTIAIAMIQDEEDSLFPHQQFTHYKEPINDAKVNNELNTQQKSELHDLLNAYSPMLTDLPGETNAIFHTINLTTNSPVRSRPYNVPY